MYGWIWHHLPGPWPVRAVLALGLAAAVVIALFTWGFPAVDRWLGLNEVTVG